MLSDAKIGVVVPAYQEAKLVGRTLRSMPGYVDRIVVVNDASTDATSDAVRAIDDSRVHLIVHPRNLGVGASIRTGYEWCLEEGLDVLCVMAGDNQMHPDDLFAVAEPVVKGQADYVKGNRFAHPSARQMPLLRRVAGRGLSTLTRFFTGLAVDDTQCGFTALSAQAARALPLSELWPRFGYPNDLLGMLASSGLRVAEVSVRPVYGEEQSLVRPWHALVVSGVIVRRYLLEAGRTERVVLTESRPGAGPD